RARRRVRDRRLVPRAAPVHGGAGPEPPPAARGLLPGARGGRTAGRGRARALDAPPCPRPDPALPPRARPEAVSINEDWERAAVRWWDGAGGLGAGPPWPARVSDRAGVVGVAARVLGRGGRLGAWGCPPLAAACGWECAEPDARFVGASSYFRRRRLDGTRER